MRKTLHTTLRLKRKPKYALVNLNRMQTIAFVGASASLALIVLAFRTFQ